MKKYVSLAVILGAIIAINVSVPAQAETPDAPADNYAKDRAECEALVSAPTTEGAAPSEGDTMAALSKCLAVKGHSADKIKKEEEAKAVTAPSAAPAAPAAH